MSIPNEPKLQFIPKDNLRVFDDLAALATYLWQGSPDDETAQGYVLFRPDTGGYYVFSRRRFLELALAARQCLFRAFDLPAIAELFHVHEYTAAPVVAESEVPRTASVTIERHGGSPGAQLSGAWVAAAPSSTPVLPSAPRRSFRGLGTGNRDVQLRTFKPNRRSPASVTRSLSPAFDAQLGEDAPAEAVEEFRRTPHLNTRAGDRIVPGARVTVEVYADDLEPAAGEAVSPIVIPAPASVSEFPLRVHLTVTPPFTVEDPAEQDLLLRRSEKASPRLAFSIRVDLNAPHGAQGMVKAVFHHDGRPAGQVSRMLMVEGEPSAAVGSPPTAPAAPARASADPAPPAVLVVDPGQIPADLTITVLNPSRDGRTFDCCVQTSALTGYVHGMWKPWLLPDVTSEVVKGYFSEFTKPAVPEARLASLKGAGKMLFASSPTHFQEAFWALVNAGRPPRAILIVSEEPYYPWELMIPHRVANGRKESRQPLGVEFLMGRWPARNTTSPVQDITLTDSFVLAPSYPGPKPARLPHASDEAKFVAAQFPGKPISPASFAGISNCFKSGGASLIHFVCHGAASTPVAQQIYLEDGTEFTSTQVGGMDEMAEALGARRTLFFLNACETGGAQPSLIGTGGFAAALVEAGASAVVAPFWSVADDVAHDVALEFYQAAKNEPGTPFAEILRRIRSKAFIGATGGEDTYAAYSYYGDPLASNGGIGPA